MRKPGCVPFGLAARKTKGPVSRLGLSFILIWSFSRGRRDAPFPGYGSVAPVSAAPPGKMAARLAAKHKNKRPSLSFYLMPGNDGGRPARHPPGRCYATFKSAPGGFVPTPESAHRQTTDKTKGSVFRLSLFFYLMPGNSLLSHGETPHYHRRYGVSLLSSAWGQVGPPR